MPALHGHGISALATGTPLNVDGQEAVYWLVSAHGTVFNYTGHPAIVLPYRLDPDGLTHRGADCWANAGAKRACWRSQQAVSEVTGPFRRPPGY